MINGNMVGGTSPIKTLTIVDSEGVEFTGVVVDSEVVFTANAAEDIREGKVAATDAGVVTGGAIIPNYNTYTGFKIITEGSRILLVLQDDYDYTKLQAIICNFNKNVADSVSAEQIAIENKVFNVQSTDALASITKDAENTLVDFGITNTSGNKLVLRYFLCKELY